MYMRTYNDSEGHTPDLTPGTDVRDVNCTRVSTIVLEHKKTFVVLVSAVVK